MLSINPKEISTGKLHGYLLGAIAPRPIAFASTIDADGNPNLSPFSFFNVFGSNPPVLIFSPARRVRDNTTKHTLENSLATKEVVINIVNYDIVQQMSLSSTEYPEGVNEFEKAGFTMLPSDEIKPFRVAESPVQFECKVKDVIFTGNEGGAGNLIVCEVVKIHISEDVLADDGSIDQHKIDLVARAGGSYYTRARDGFFEIPKPIATLGIGVDAIPLEIRNSPILTGNNLGMLGNVEQLPTEDTVNNFGKEHSKLIGLEMVKKHTFAQEYLSKNDVESAWKVLLLK
ncbi:MULTISPECIES: flavin reductase family protein [unclassified Polaribacter]|jgi:flavin reductase (DIM6/NTAB) family NADH-FMN oxidoreductase RutF|uniref:flavin reductase family protein n=1 Tax=unclassified Polaribacter TaxID=196858 RepID=UPI00052CEA19|nr:MULTISPECIES: flavin reductase family protein [unclassified Polaribacter]KGL58450.1 flavin reductase domain protein-containin FMN-binding protein [Polaribacter sp. Hel1_33_49]PKV65889.1 flavin reductase (DIM6/NTAB) family NADH-FMN oxidoreductase RutF [Polaribacter sp. Hel1_33_96]